MMASTRKPLPRQPRRPRAKLEHPDLVAVVVVVVAAVVVVVVVAVVVVVVVVVVAPASPRPWSGAPSSAAPNSAPQSSPSGAARAAAPPLLMTLASTHVSGASRHLDSPSLDSHAFP